MKTLVLILAMVAACGAVAQPPGEPPYIGIFYEYDQDTFDPGLYEDGVHPQANFTPPVGAHFWVHVVAFGLEELGYTHLVGYELGLLTPPEDSTFYPTSGWYFYTFGPCFLDCPNDPHALCVALGYTDPRPLTGGHLSLMYGRFFLATPLATPEPWLLGPWGYGQYPRLAVRRADGTTEEISVNLPIEGYAGGWGVVATMLANWVSVPQAPALPDRLAAAPNPFNPATTFTVDLARGGPVRITIYNSRGQRAGELDLGRRDAGRHTATWQARDRQGRDLSAGVYFAALERDGARQGEIIKLSLVR